MMRREVDSLRDQFSSPDVHYSVRVDWECIGRLFRVESWFVRTRAGVKAGSFVHNALDTSEDASILCF